MTVLKSLLPSGLLATIVGGIVGVYAGVLAGGPIADTFAPKKIDLRPFPHPGRTPRRIWNLSNCSDEDI